MPRLITLFLISALLKISFTQNLELAIANTDSLFNALLRKYETTELTNETKKVIDEEVDQYLQVVLNKFRSDSGEVLSHEVNIHETGVGIFDGLEEILNLSINDVKDVNFFKKYNGYEQWFAITLTSSGVIVYRVIENTLSLATYYPAENTSNIYVATFQGNVFLIVKKSQSVQILYFFSQDGKFILREIKNLPIPNVKHLSSWHETNELFICASTSTETNVYAWQQDNLVLLQALPFGSELCTFVHVGGSTFLVVSGNWGTRILSYQSSTHRFLDRAQSVIRRRFRNAAFARLMRVSQVEGFLALASVADGPTIVYKHSELNGGVFAPFQELPSADRLLAVTTNNTAVLLLERGAVVDVYQYDGWRFVRLNHQIFDVQEMKVVVLSGEQQLLVKRLDGNWSLNRILWMKSKEPINMNEEIQQWCAYAKGRVKQAPKSIPERKNAIEFSKGQIKKIKAKNINGLNNEMLHDLTERYSELVSRFQMVNESLNQAIPIMNATFDTLRVDIVHANCTDQCSAKKLVTKIKCNNFSNLRTMQNESQVLKFEHVKVEKLDGFPCPKAAIKIEEINVNGLVNGIKFEDLEKNTLKLSGDQVVSGEHIFVRVQAEGVIAPNLDVASSQTRQKIKTRAVYVDDLILTDGGMLLPLDGPPVTMSGTLTARRAKFTGLVDQHGALKGRVIERYRPQTDFYGHHELTGNYTLADVNVVQLLSADDVVRDAGRSRSLKEIAEGAIPLDGDVPVKMKFSRDLTRWTNITVENLPKWLTKKNSQMVKVTGKKIALKTITLPDFVYAKLPTPKLDAYACSVGAVTSDIKTSYLKVGEATANIVHSEHVYGAKELENIMNDSITSLDEIDLSQQNLTGYIHVENLNISDFEKSSFHSFAKSKFEWYQPNHIKGPYKAENLNVGSLNTLEGLKMPPPKEVQNMVIEGNLQVKTINGIDFDEFIKNMVRIDEEIFFDKIKFGGSVEVDEIEVENTNIDLRILEENVNLGNKTITGNLEIEGDLYIPNILLSYPDEEDLTYIVEGSVTFEKEPDVENINGKNLHQLISEIWMLNRDVNLTGNIVMKNITLNQPFDLYYHLHTPKFGSWESLEKRILSKTKFQDIQVPVHFREVIFPNIMTRGNSTLKSSDQYLNDLLFMTLKKNENQTIQDKWRFEKLIIKDNLTLLGRINNLNLSIDVARHDVEFNRVTGKKVLDKLTIRNLDGSNFGEWAKDALMQTADPEKVIVINGKKDFHAFNARNMNVSGTIMGKKLEECLLKTGDQVITAAKKLKGSLHTSSLVVGGLINDLNLTEFANILLKKSEHRHKLKSKMIFKSDLHILGNVTIRGKIQGAELEKASKINEILTPTINIVEYLEPFTIAITDAVKHQAKFWNKFELVEENILLPTANHVPVLYESSTFFVLGTCIMRTLSEMMCNGRNKFTLKTFSTDASDILISQMISLENIPHVVQVTSGSRSRITIYIYRKESNSFDIATSIRAPGIVEASALAIDDVVWIVTRLKSEMFVVRYQPRVNLLQKYHLPETRFFALARIPATGELVLVREDGVWRLEGLAGPRRAFAAKLVADSVETFSLAEDFFIRLTCRNNGTVLLKALYGGV